MMEYKDGVYSVDSEKDDDWLRTPEVTKEEYAALDMALEMHKAEQKKAEKDDSDGSDLAEGEIVNDTGNAVDSGEKALLSLAPRERAWDAGAADARVRRWAGAEDAPNAKYASAFMWHDAANAADFGAYKLPFVDVVDGQAMAVPKGVFAVNQRLQQTHMPEEAKEAVKRKVSAYYAEMRQKWEDPTLKPAWEEGKKGVVDDLLMKGMAWLGALRNALVQQPMGVAAPVLAPLPAPVASPAADGAADGEKAGMGRMGGTAEGPGGECVCPECGHTTPHKVGEPCDESECPECGAKMGRAEAAEKGVVVDGFELPEADFRALTVWLHGTKADDGRQLGGFAFKARDGRDWWFQWTTNAFMDREGEIFTTASLDDCIARNAEHDVKGQFWFWHTPGTKFGDIRWQARVGRFLVEAGPFDETPTGQAFKGVFQAYPYGHPVVSPEGWGTSHGFFYSRSDREDGVFERFAKKESTVLPARFASNPHNPQPFIVREGNAMEEYQRVALEALGGKELVAQIVTAGEQRTKELEEAGIAFKSMDKEEDEKSASTIAQLRAIAGKESDAEIKKVILAFAKDLEAATSGDSESDGAAKEPEEEEAKKAAAKKKDEEFEEEAADSEPMVKAEEEDEDEEEEEPEAKKDSAALTRQEVADAISGVVQTLREETQESMQEAIKSVIGQITQELTPLVETIAEMKRADDERLGEKAQETPAASLHDLVGRAVGNKATKLTKRQVEKAEKGGPAETAAADNGPVVTGVPMVDAFLNAGP